jgi:hypothetical protein
MDAQSSRLFGFDDPADTRYAHTMPVFARVLHIFHSEWPGVRAAAGYLPGRKLAISAQADVSPFPVSDILHAIMDLSPQRVIFHGWSDQAMVLCNALLKEVDSDRLFIVFHGSPNQWHDDYDRRQALTCLRLAREGAVRKVHVLKSGFELPVQRLFRPMLFNLSPNISNMLSAQDSRQFDKGVIALVPARKTWTKNVFTNVLGAASSARVQTVQTVADDLALPYPFESKLRQVSYSELDPLEIYQHADIVLNVSTADCHPMINIEAQTFGKACLRAPLFLDALEYHPYVALTTVDDSSSITEIRRCIDRLLDIPAGELRAVALDYQAASDEISLRRYREFLELP